MTTYLHIGLEKTGTTSIQYLFAKNRKTLLQSGFLIPESVHLGNCYHLAIASYSKFRSDGLTRQLKIANQSQLDQFRNDKVAALKKEVARHKPKNVLLSSEHFQSRLLSSEDISLLRQSLTEAGLKEFRVIVYLRDPLKIAMSHHGMAIKKGVHVTDDFYRPTHPRISQIIDFEVSLAAWASVFGEENLIVKLYPEGAAANTLISDFVKTVNLTEGDLDLSLTEKRNSNVSAAALIALNNLNANSERVKNAANNTKFFDALEAALPGKGLTPSAATIEEFNEFYEGQYQRITKRYFGTQSKLFETKWKAEELPSESEVATAERVILGLMRKIELAALPRKIVRRIKNLLG